MSDIKNGNKKCSCCGLFCHPDEETAEGVCHDCSEHCEECGKIINNGGRYCKDCEKVKA